MSLTTCPECGGSVPTGRPECPFCGAPAEEAGSHIESNLITRTKLHADAAGADAESSREKIPSVPARDARKFWNPLVVTVVSVPLGFLFGGILVALNWHALRKHFWAILIWLFTVFYVLYVQAPLLEILRWPWTFFVGFIVWFPAVVLTQHLHFRRVFPFGYSRRAWLLPVSLGIAFDVTLMIWIAYDQKASVGKLLPPPAAIIEQPYTPDQLAKLVSPTVAEVEVRWKESFLVFFSEHRGMAGSAVLIRSDSTAYYFVTNRHVVEAPAESNEYSCILHLDGDSVRTQVVAYAKNGLDLALLRYAPEGRPTAFKMLMLPLENVPVGQSCVAIGNALGAGLSVTTGVVSKIDDFGHHKTIRTSAPISPGNSGGGLFSLNGGFLIGITTETLTGEGTQNINFAIPTNYFAEDEAWDFFTKPVR